MTTVVVTGGDGFFGWHLRARLHALRPEVTVRVAGRREFGDGERLAHVLSGADAVVHLAGANRGDPEEVAATNRTLAATLATALEEGGGAPTVVYADSIHRRGDSTYGASKRQAGETLGSWADARGARMVDLVLPNLFGEHGRPHYNSAVATFCHDLAHGESSEVNQGGRTRLLHVQDACREIVRSIDEPERRGVVDVDGEEISIPDLYDRLAGFRADYHGAHLPALPTRLDLRLFNTLRSHLFPAFYPQPLVAHADARGAFAEIARGHCQTQTSVSTTGPGITRGEHFHFDKIERFVVVRGQARMEVRRLLTTEIWTVDVRGTEPVAVDMPTLQVHNIINTGDEELVTIFWANDHFDPAEPDTIAEAVRPVAKQRQAS